MQILLDDIAIRLDDGMAFEHTTWHVLQHQNWALIGGTAAGKSMLLNCICRRLPLAYGCIRYFFDQQDESVSRQYFLPGEIVQFSPQTHSNFMQRYTSYYQARWQSFEGDGIPTVEELLKDSAGVLDRPSRNVNGLAAEGDMQKKLADVVEIFDLSSIRSRKIFHLSHGESRKVFIARLLMKRPKLLILDDPFTGLDEQSRLLLSEGIDRLLQQGEPMVLTAVSKVGDICEGATHLAVVKDKQMIAQGEKRSLQQHVDEGIILGEPSHQGSRVSKKIPI